MKALFWNLNGKPLEELVARIVAEHDRDFIVLAETDGIDDAKLVEELSRACRAPFCHHTWEPQSRLKFYSRYAPESVRPLHDSAGISIKSVQFPGCQPIIVAGIHSPSRLYWSEPSDRWALGARIRDRLEEVELQEGHQRSVLLGDFNSDPFDDALTNSDALHAVMSKRLALEVSRVVGGERRQFLYNPTWSLFGDADPGPPGTYYYRRSNSSCRFWHLFDQVLLRPSLAKDFDHGSLQVITSAGDDSLSGNGDEPNVELGSDHFPLIFSLNLAKEHANVG